MFRNTENGGSAAKNPEKCKKIDFFPFCPLCKIEKVIIIIRVANAGNCIGRGFNQKESGVKMAEKERGKVKWFNNSKGYGFIERASGGDIFLHYSSIKVDGYRTVKEGQEVEFIVTNGTKGLQADEVVPLN